MQHDLSHLDRIARHLPEGDDLTLITIKGHLLVEELLDSIIESRCADTAPLRDIEIGFRIKLRLAQALTGYADLKLAWIMAERLNALRNAIAHKLEHPLAKKRLDLFLDTFRAPELKFTFTGSAGHDLKQAIVFMLGFLVGAVGDPFPDCSGLALDT